MNRRFAAALAAAIAITGTALPAGAEAGALFGAARGAIAKRALKPAPQQAAKQATQEAAGKPRDVIIHRSKHPEAAAHIEHAQRHGQPTVLTIDRAGAAERRRESTGSVSLKNRPGPHYERDEYPPALVRQGGSGASVRLISPHDNRGAGSSMRAQTRDLPDGSKIRVLVTD